MCNKTKYIGRCGLLSSTLLFLFSLWTISPASAQTTTGNITGIVTDTSSAVIVGATVTAHNVSTGVNSQAVTNAPGSYPIQFLPIGQYQLTIEASGFGTQSIPAFSLEIDQTAKFNIQLKAGG